MTAPGRLPVAKLPSPILVNANWCAAYIGVSVSTFQRYVRDGRIAPGLKLGPRAMRWRVSDLDAYIERLRQEASSS